MNEATPSDIGRSLRFGARMDVIRFTEGQWWAIDMTGAERGPVTRKDAYLIAVSYMNAQEIADYNAHAADAELERQRPTPNATEPESK